MSLPSKFTNIQVYVIDGALGLTNCFLWQNAHPLCLNVFSTEPILRFSCIGLGLNFGLTLFMPLLQPGYQLPTFRFKFPNGRIL